ncbi:hypothetical protein TBLA_0J01400 [Henningerozyma blattae CBS 6284]|uniref:Uncharacterized protein n=1 Tax=Henningerozyma blattae (strain ATCC 34711 / CBS 6284 / DSM 70876 / NBRC 10599 / NRRL Y-10934 / UCD 77-7) TaxID=1071380 RepID=I2H9T4_HENB6|nr:hypothetical protein TBLA_0J01400 [Tetrapisispora blattae CBS 6284]CCH63136.1 hypothetical protein TBLA_0J01400 [Tetrapisispora blattae CBS 6284]
MTHELLVFGLPILSTFVFLATLFFLTFLFSFFGLLAFGCFCPFTFWPLYFSLLSLSLGSRLCLSLEIDPSVLQHLSAVVPACKASLSSFDPRLILTLPLILVLFDPLLTQRQRPAQKHPQYIRTPFLLRDGYRFPPCFNMGQFFLGYHQLTIWTPIVHQHQFIKYHSSINWTLSNACFPTPYAEFCGPSSSSFLFS